LEVDPLYELLAFPIILLLIYLFLKRSLAGGYLLTGVALITPAFPIAFNHIAWTPFAERYVYIALGFIVPAAIFFLGKVNIRASIYYAVIASLIVFFGVSTFQRSLVWKTNESLWRDSIEKSPQSQKAWNNYGVALHRNGRYGEAEKVFSVAASKTQFGYIDKYDVNMAVSMLSLQEYDRAQQKLLTVLKRSRGTSDIALNVLLKLAEDDQDLTEERLSEIRSTLLDLARDSDSPGYYYQLGRFSKEQKKYTEAKSFFEKAYAVALDADSMKKKAEKALKSLP
jgi:tetratricopeptide (TPR) repeat protein